MVEFPLTYRLAIEGAEQAKGKLDEVSAAFDRGEASAKELNTALRESDKANMNVSRSFGRMDNALRAAHPNFNILERSMARIGSVARTLVGLFDSWNILQLRISASSTDLARAQDRQEQATRKVKELKAKMVAEDAPAMLKAVQEENEAIRETAEITERNAAALQSQNTWILAGALVAIPSLIRAAKEARLPLIALGGGSLATGTALTILYTAITAVSTSAIAGAANAFSWRDAVGSWPTTADDARKAVGSLYGTLKDIPVIGPFLAEMTAGFVQITAKAGEWAESVGKSIDGTIVAVKDWDKSTTESISKTLTSIGATAGIWGAGFQKYFFELFTDIGNIIGSWGTSTVEWFTGLPSMLSEAMTDLGSFITTSIFSSLTNAGNIIGSWGTSTVEWFTALPGRIGAGLSTLANILSNTFKLAFNSVISLVNRAIAGLNTIHVSIPWWVPGIGGYSFGLNLASIPHLATGTKNFEGGQAIVGERGRELVTLPRGTSVSPAGSFGNITVFMTVHTSGDARGFARTASEELRRELGTRFR